MSAMQPPYRPGALERRLDDALAERRQRQRYRQRRTLASPQGARVQVDGGEALAFCSNDYLGLAGHPRIAEAFRAAATRYGVGSGASHLICGHGEEHHRLEEELAAFCGRERALLLSSGYMANFGAINALSHWESVTFQDRLNHASLMDGGFVSRGQVRKFRHNDMADLEQQLAETHREALIAVDAVYSMDGDLAPLPALADLARRHDATLMADDAHGFGWLGEDGAGACQYWGIGQVQVPLLMGTLGKALGCYGAFLAGRAQLIDALVQFCRPYVYTTALPPAVAAAARAALAVVHEEPWRRRHLQDLISRFRRRAAVQGVPLMDSHTPIQPVPLGDEGTTMAVAGELTDAGFWVGAIRPPTVPDGSSRLRVSLSAAHSMDEVDQLLDALATALEARR